MQHQAQEGNRGPGYTQHPKHRITLDSFRGEVKLLLEGITLASSPRALVMQETHYAPVYYFPRRDVRMELLARTGHSSYCPFKGHASYWTIRTDGKAMENAAWSYEAPFDEVFAIKDCIAFHGHGLEFRKTEAR